MTYEEQVREALNAESYRRAHRLPFDAPVPEWAYHRRRHDHATDPMTRVIGQGLTERYVYTCDRTGQEFMYSTRADGSLTETWIGPPAPAPAGPAGPEPSRSPSWGRPGDAEYPRP